MKTGFFLVIFAVFFLADLISGDDHKSLRIAEASNSSELMKCTVYQGATCNSNGILGVCVSKSSGCCTGSFNSGPLCPGSSDIQV